MGHIFLKYGKIFHLSCLSSCSNNSFPILPKMAECEVSAIYLFPIDLKLLGHLFLSTSLPHAKVQPHLPSNYLIMIFQSSCPERSFVKVVQARHIQMSCHFAWSIISSYHSPPPKLSSCDASIWAQLQILVSGQNFSLWSKYIYLVPLWLKIFLGLLVSI